MPTEYERICAEECPEGCGKGWPILRSSSFEPQFPNATAIHHDPNTLKTYIACAAPTRDAVIERQAAEIAALKTELQAAHDTHDARMKEKNAELLKAHIAATKAYLSSPAMKTFAELKTSKAGTILSMLQDGAISRGKACEALAILAHGVDWDDIPLPVENGRQFGEDEVPADVVEALKASMRQIASGEKSLVMFGSNGCLTDDCDHWDDGTCSMKDPYCRIGRTIDATPER